MTQKCTSGIYLLNINVVEPTMIQDKRIIDKGIYITTKNFKVGKYDNLNKEKKKYIEHFGEENVSFEALGITYHNESILISILIELEQYRMIGDCGRKNEWLENISIEDTIDKVGSVFEEYNGAILENYIQVEKYRIIQNITKDYQFNLSNENIKKVLTYLPYFSEDHQFGKWDEIKKEEGVITAPHLSYSNTVQDFIKLLYDVNFILNFDWAKWSEGRKIISDINLIQQSDLLTLRMLFTAVVRNERFCEGMLLSKIKNKTILNILLRLNTINNFK